MELIKALLSMQKWIKMKEMHILVDTREICACASCFIDGQSSIVT